MCVVVLATELTPELIAEGLAKDLVRVIQDRRKEMGLELYRPDRRRPGHRFRSSLSKPLNSSAVTSKEKPWPWRSDFTPTARRRCRGSKSGRLQCNVICEKSVRSKARDLRGCRAFVLNIDRFNMSASSSRSFKIAVLISGGGTTLKNLIERISDGRLHVAISLVISSNPQAGGLKFAREADIPSLVIEQKNFPDQDTFSREIFGRCRAAGRRPGRIGRISQAIDDPRGFQRSRDQYSSRAYPGLLRQGILRASGARGGAGIRRETQRVYGPFRRQSIRSRPGDSAKGRAGDGRRHAGHARRPRFRSRVRGLSRGRRTDRPGPSPHRIAARANSAARSRFGLRSTIIRKQTGFHQSLPRTSPLAPRR